jgi:beta-phosphoglucomutase-like phosphatase (HAD superfamily)
MQTAFLFDLDGTLVDSVYLHVLAWREALDRPPQVEPGLERIGVEISRLTGFGH